MSYQNLSDEELTAEYQKLMHACQSGIAMLMNYNSNLTDGKHLRVGVDSALVSNAALTQLLINKGIFSHREFIEQLLASTQEEVDRLTSEVRSHFPDSGTEISLA